jgi:hypothetical protein
LIKKWLKSDSQKEQINTISMLKISLRPVSWGIVFEVMGSSKNAYFENVFKMPKKLLKMLKNGPNMIQKWVKIP